MAKKRNQVPVEESSGNVFADLGLSDPEERLAKADLAIAISREIQARGLTQGQAAGAFVTLDINDDEEVAFAARNRGDDSYYFILGLDAFREIGSWKDFREVFPLCNFIVTSRPGSRKTNLLSGVSIAVQKLFCYDSVSKIYRHRSGTTLHFLQLTDFAVSASDIRARVRQNKSIRYLVPKTVQDYIASQALYSEPAEGNHSID
jgi:nicotinate (nicotinamide) nucleotide adenylyltransferase